METKQCTQPSIRVLDAESDYMSAISSGQETPGYHQGKPQALAARGEGNPEVTVHAPVTCRSSLHSICQAFHDLSTPQTSSARQATFPAFKIASSFRSSFSLSKSSPYLLPAPPEPTSRNCLLLARLSSGPQQASSDGGPGRPGGRPRWWEGREGRRRLYHSE